MHDDLRPFVECDCKLAGLVSDVDRAIYAKDLRSNDWFAIGVNDRAGNVVGILMTDDLRPRSRPLEPSAVTESGFDVCDPQRDWRDVFGL